MHPGHGRLQHVPSVNWDILVSVSYVLLCADPLSPRRVDPTFALDAEAARDAGMTCITFDHDHLDNRINPAAALRSMRVEEPGVAVYRGWMMRAEAYDALFHALSDRRVRLITSPSAYAACHHAIGSYPKLKKWMAETSWITCDRIHDTQDVQGALAVHGRSAVIVKDWVKSQASDYWNEACYIPDASDFEQASRVIARFIELQGDSLVGGLVFKRYLPLLPVGGPAYEYRAFIVNGKVVGWWPRFEMSAQPLPPPRQLLAEIAENVPSPFASADVAIDVHGQWWLLEVGDGQVSGLPSPDAAAPLMRQLAELLRNRAAMPT
jgi:hypothetical protein